MVGAHIYAAQRERTQWKIACCSALRKKRKLREGGQNMNKQNNYKEEKPEIYFKELAYRIVSAGKSEIRAKQEAGYSKAGYSSRS